MNHQAGLDPDLQALADARGLITSYVDALGQPHQATPDVVLAVLAGLGAPLERAEDARSALREARLAERRRILPPVCVAWDGSPTRVRLTLPSEKGIAAIDCRLETESGEVMDWALSRDELRDGGETTVENQRFAEGSLLLPPHLPFGYHRLRIRTGAREASCTVLSAPSSFHSPDGTFRDRSWGVFAPTYAIHSDRSWGSGDLTDLGSLMQWVGDSGGDVVGTLPLLASFLDEPFHPSPYTPASRLFWNEAYLDPASLPEFEHCPGARALWESSALRSELARLRRLPLASHRRTMAAKRKVLEALARTFFEDGWNDDAFHRFVAADPYLPDYARFRAEVERSGTCWREWSVPARNGELDESYGDADAVRYHLYVQWSMQRQLERLDRQGGVAGVGLYLDFPIGVHPDSYDVWRERTLFADRVATGAPPDGFFVLGQNWGLPPLVPDANREDGYRYLATCVRRQMRHASLLRIDHVMGLHRLFWVPRGTDARDGLYVRYPQEELYAVFGIESSRAGCAVAGEDLGTVPDEVREAMERHDLQRLYVGQFEVDPTAEVATRPVPERSVASLNTHDMRPFMGFLDGLDVGDRVDLGLLDATEAAEEMAARSRTIEALVAALGRSHLSEAGAAEPLEILRAWLRWLASSPARFVILNLEDLWLEGWPQNVPGTDAESLNWVRKTRMGLEGILRSPELAETMRQVAAARGTEGETG
jgi:4-alpha-glucanotransferase